MTWLRAIADWTVIAWLLAAIFLHFTNMFDANRDGRVYRIVRAVFWELRPFFLPATVIKAAVTLALLDFEWLDGIAFVCNLWDWWTLKDPRDDDDDRWKRRREKAKSVIEVTGSRLVVAPAVTS